MAHLPCKRKYLNDLHFNRKTLGRQNSRLGVIYCRQRRLLRCIGYTEAGDGHLRDPPNEQGRELRTSAVLPQRSFGPFKRKDCVLCTLMN